MENRKNKRLTRSTTEVKIGGVCAGIANYFDVDPTWIRIAYAAFSIITCIFTGIILYIALYLIIPKDSSVEQWRDYSREDKEDQDI